MLETVKLSSIGPFGDKSSKYSPLIESAQKLSMDEAIRIDIGDEAPSVVRPRLETRLRDLGLRRTLRLIQREGKLYIAKREQR